MRKVYKKIIRNNNYMSNLTKFNTQLESLIDELARLYPEFMDVKIFREKFYIAKKSNPKMILLIFLKYIYPYKEHIMKKNEQFFLSDDLTRDLKTNTEIHNAVGEDSEYVLTKALNLKTLWNGMSGGVKNTMWQYFQVLIVLCERYVAENAS